MNKKAIFMPTFAIIIFIILVYAFGTLIVKPNQDKTFYIGTSQIELSNTYQNAELDLLYLQNLIKYTTYITTEEFNKNGGLKKECNVAWRFNSNCNPDLENNFINLFKAKFGQNYKIKDVKIENNVLVLTFDLDYSKKFKNFEIEYKLQPELRQELAIDFNKLNTIKTQIKDCVENKKDLNNCVNEKSMINDDIISFSIENNKNILVLTDKLEFKKLDFKFSINQKDTGIQGKAF